MRRYTKEQLLAFLKKLSHELGKSPTIDDMNRKKKFPSSSTYMARFGSWNNSLRAAGLKLNVRRKYSKQELLENLRLLAKELGRPPKTPDLKERKWTASASTYRKYFGSWRQAIKEAGLLKHKLSVLKDFSKRK